MSDKKTHWFFTSATSIFILFFVSIYLKTILFHLFIFGSDDLTQLIYFSKFVPALCIASFVFITKRKVWTAIFLFLADVWLISNIIYFKANEALLDIETTLLVNNMQGFWSSVLLYLNWELIPFLVISILYTFYLTKYQSNGERHWKLFISIVLFTFIIHFLDLEYRREIGLFHSKAKQKEISEKYGHYTIFFRDAKYKACGNHWRGMDDYVEKNTIFHYFPAQFVYYKYKQQTINQKVEFTSSDSLSIQKRILIPAERPHANKNLFLIIVESLESWPLGMTDVNGQEITPTLNKFSQQADFVCLNCKSQVRRGVSGDGQLIINTGLLPMETNVACMAYGTNTYPNFAQYFKSSFTINPCPNVWNQAVVNPQYGYKELVEMDNSSADSSWLNDHEIFSLAVKTLDRCEFPTCMQVITYSTHTPFKVIATDNLQFHNDMPTKLQNYLHALHYTDSCINYFLTELHNHPQFSDSTTIVITGDHTVFKSYMLQSFKPFVEKHSLSIPTTQSYCPLLITSKCQTNKQTKKDSCFQMDIFPTITHFIGLEETYWKGFGINLMDSSATRTITEDSSYYLSNKLIIDNFFKNIPVYQNQ